jgi:hypothetical protein
MFQTSAGAEYDVQLYTKSSYAVNGDSGIFTVSGSGAVLSGSIAAYDRLRNEIQEADPRLISAALAAASRISGAAGLSSCGSLAGFAGVVGLSAIFAPELLPGLADFFDSGGGLALSGNAAVCGSYLAL